MAGAMSSRPTRHSDGQIITGASRILALAVGVVLIGVGCVAVFTTDNGAGSLGILAGGVFVTIVGVTGHRPNRLVIGGNVLMWEKLDQVQESVSDLTDRVWQLFLVTMAPSMHHNLEKLASGHFGEYKLGGGLRRELEYLRDHGYIEDVPPGVPDEGPDLSPYIVVTDTGRRFLELRRHVE